MSHGDRIQVRAWYSTVLADLDFETYSEAGYVKRNGKWKTVVTSAKNGIGCVGAARYAQDETTHLWSLAYNLKDGRGKRLWVPGMPDPQDLFDHIAAGLLLEAHNSEFEYFIWKYVCHARLGWPELPLIQLRCSAGQARAQGLPGSLKEATKATRVLIQKMSVGERLINKFCKPQNPTGKQPLEKLDPALDPVDGALFYEYNLGDIEAESSLSAVLPDITGHELEVWQADKAINARGVQVDAVGMAAAIGVVNEAIEVETAVLTKLTGGMVDSANKNAKFIEWLRLQGADMPNMQKETVAAKLADPGDMPPQALRALKIRDAIGGAAVKKLFALRRYIMLDGRVRGIFVYHGAHTGRWSGRGPQPQNFPNSGPRVFLCPCGAYRERSIPVCPCGRADQHPADWSPAVVSEVLRLCQYGYQTVARFFPKPLAAVSGCLRGLFVSAPGHDLICSDYSAIEAVVLAMISGEKWREDVFRGHGLIYEMSASKVTGVPFEEFIRYKAETGQDHPLRKSIGKVAELACFGYKTEVLTPQGWDCISNIKPGGYIHDGVEFVKCDGAICKGRKSVVSLGGVLVTAEHKFYTGKDSWKTTEDLKQNLSVLKLARNMADSLLLKCDSKIQGALNQYHVSVNAGASRSPRIFQISALEKRRNAINAPRSQVASRIGSFLGLTLRTRRGSLVVCRQQLEDAATPRTTNTRDMGVGALKSVMSGSTTAPYGLSTFSHSKGGITLKRLSTVSTTTRATTPGTYDLSATAPNKIIKGKQYGSSILGKKCQLPSFMRGMPHGIAAQIQSSVKLKRASRPSRLLQIKPDAKARMVFDILNAGPRSRFVIRTNYGPLIAHNSGYGGGLGAWKQFGADKFMTDIEIESSKKSWRRESPMIVKFWYGVEDAAKNAIRYPGHSFDFRGFKFAVVDNILHVRLLSGRFLHYHEPVLVPGLTPWGAPNEEITFMWEDSKTKKWVRTGTWGGCLTENLCQAIARDIEAFAIVNLEKAGYPVVLHVHDEPVSEVPEGFGSIEEYERIMVMLPDWCKHWPIKASGGWRGKRYRK